MILEKKNISISAKLFNTISERVNSSNNEFSSVDEYVEFILNEVLEDENESVYSKEEEEKIEKHLKDMGYIQSGDD